jgi:hypothetical protein
MPQCRIGRVAALPAWSLAALLLVPAAHAAPHATVEGGAALTELSFSTGGLAPRPDVALRASWWAGATIELPVRSRWALVSGLRWTPVVERDSREEQVLAWDLLVRTRTSLGYLALPLEVRFRPGSRRLAIDAGPAVGYQISADERFTDYQILGGAAAPARASRAGRAGPADVVPTFGQRVGPPARALYYPWEASFGLGVSWEIPVARHAGLVEARLSQGLTDIVRDESVRRTTRAVLLGAGWRW